jgi:hypothetical protein
LVNQPVLPLDRRPAAIADEKLVGEAVHHSEEGVDGAVQIHSDSERSAFDQQPHQTFLC